MNTKQDKAKITDVGKKDLKDLTLRSGMLSERFQEKDITIGNLVYTIRALPDLILAFAGDEAARSGVVNEAAQVFETIRFGLVKISPLKGDEVLDRHGDEIEMKFHTEDIMGFRWTRIMPVIIHRLEISHMKNLFVKIVDHSKLKDKEADSLDSTTASVPVE